MSTGWAQATKIMATVALAATAALAIGCGPAPGYEPEPRVPMAYAPVGDTSVEQYPEPISSEELQARADAQAAAGQNAPNAENVQAAPGDIVVGDDPTTYSDTDPSALTEFKPALDGHGQWVDDATYGTVWVPSEAEVGTDFVPYSTAGHWTYADDTNYVWVSDYSWGWAPFHYGRWAHVGHHGWVWIPGRTYAGAWVDWRYGDGYDYVGWAPMGPSWYWSGGYALGWGWGWTPYYSYCHRDYLYNPYVGRHVVYGNDPRAREHESHTRPYVAAAPGVGAGGAGGGRVAASPTVGGSGRIAATPTVGHAGPPPSRLGIAPKMVVAPPTGNAGLARAQALASPSTAVAQGAAPPSTSVRRRIDHEGVVASPSPRPALDGRGPVVNNRFDTGARSPQVQGVQPSSPHASSVAPSARSFSTSPNTPVATAPSYRGAPSVPSYRPSPGAQSAPAYRPAPSYRPAPGISQSTPSYRAAPSFSAPAQSYHPSAPAFHSAPSYSAPHTSAPASRPSAPRSSGGSSRGGHR